MQLTLLMSVRMAVVMLVIVVMGMIMLVGTRLSRQWSHAMVVVMHIPLMVVVMVMDDQGARRTALVGMVMTVVMVLVVLVLMMMVMPMFMGMVVLVLMIVLMVVILAGNARLAASAYATHINLPRCR